MVSDVRNFASLEVPPVTQVLLVTDGKRYGDTIPVLWAALVETEECYRSANVPLTVRRYCLCDDTPLSLPRPSAAHSAPPVPDILEMLRSDARGRYARTFDQERMVDVIRRILSVNADAYLQLVVDVDITPPVGWRYIISDDVANATVTSIPPTDPRYWQVQARRAPDHAEEPDASRLSTIKHRIRTACIGSLGERMGFARCENSRCVFFNKVDAVTRLDGMLGIGPEHSELPPLHFMGYARVSADPAVVQPLEPLWSLDGTLRMRDGASRPSSVASEAIELADVDEGTV